MDAPAVRQEKELIDATRAFAKENRAQSWFALLSTLALVAGTDAIAFRGLGTAHDGIVRGVASVVCGLLIVRTFILFHDFQHGSLLRGSKIARGIFFVYGLVIMTPPNSGARRTTITTRTRRSSWARTSART